MTVMQERPVLERPIATPARPRRVWIWGVTAAILLSTVVFITLGDEEIPERTLMLGPRHDGVVFVPEYVGQSGGDLPAIESSPLSMGVRHTDGVSFVPEFVGYADGIHPEDG